MSRLAVPQLLDAFEVHSAADFGRLEPARRHAFLRRLRRTLAAAVEPTRRELHLADGLELYFAARLRPDGAATDLPDAETLKAAVLLGERTLVTFAFHEVEPAAGEVAGDAPPTLAWSAEEEDGEADHRVHAAEFAAFLDLLCTARPAIAAGAVHVLPLFPGDRHGELRFRHETTPARLSDGGTADDAFDARAVPAVRLPSLAALPLERVVALRDEAGPAHALRTALAALLAADAGDALGDVLAAVDGAAEALAERLHQPGDGVLLALPPHGPDAALAAGELRRALDALHGARRVRPLAEWRPHAARELHLPWQPHVATAP